MPSVFDGVCCAGIRVSQKCLPRELRDRQVQHCSGPFARRRVHERDLRCHLHIRVERGLHLRAFGRDDADFGIYRVSQKAGEEIRRFDDLMSYRLSADDAERDAQARVRRYHLPVRSGVLLRRPDGHGKAVANERSTRWRSACATLPSSAW